MFREQIYARAFKGSSPQAAKNRLLKLVRDGYLEQQYMRERRGKILAVFLNTPKAVKALANDYRFKITSELCKSDSIEHDLCLVDLRDRLQRFALVTNYYTENMLQGCAEFRENGNLQPFVDNNTDIVLEVTRQGKKILVGVEFENSEKARERYVRKLVSYYSDRRTPAIFYICSNARIRDAVGQAELQVAGSGTPRCFYALLADVLEKKPECTFVDLNGAKITLT